ncbi:histidinol-phosphate transaminase [Empedobacter stercoris]|uniref:histidinol-phosphate transaminase n=1 Tax=Empedobacter TaxID=59734 RepID=UPI0021AFB978|nr:MULTISPECIES: histidinol-phosphate transaminase [Empedobacter]MDM1522625.1 histidinol-phosphate transaminase [Empedobacter sp. 225-1]MDM1543819.1 histidinol-phosphate transaminase [Empedobacter sp. 189-2]UWX66449.1 histidinol-phosphate transaminase [Empedobacter stercoris]
MFNINNIIRPNVKAMKAYSSARDEFQDINDDFVFLDANENPFNNGLNRYPDPFQRKVKSILSEIKNFPTDQILLGNGSDEVLDLIFRAFCEPNQDNVIAISPSYGMYIFLANLNAVEYRKSLLNESDFQPNIEDIFSKVDENTKMIFLCSPNNPTGEIIKREAILEIVNSFNGLVIIDEAYIDFATEPSWIEEINNYPNVIVTQTLSKAVGLAGIRLGILYASQEIVEVLNKIKPPYNINQLTQLKAIEILSDYEKVVAATNTIVQQKEVLENALTEISFVEKIYPSDANFILIKVDNANERYDKLVEKGIVIRNRNNDDLCKNCLRITVGTEEENGKLVQVLKGLS